jgi:hypothetical protein
LKLLLRYRTSLGPRTIIAEIGDAATAQAVCNAHLALGEEAALCDESTRFSLKDNRAKPRRKRDRAALKVVSSLPENVTPIAKAKRAGK